MMRKFFLAPLLVAMLASGTTAAMAAEHVVTLKQRAFAPDTLSVKVGDTVVFCNDDPIEHAVASQSAAKAIDIDSLPPGESRKIVFDKAGQVDIECGYHSGMSLTVQVVQ